MCESVCEYVCEREKGERREERESDSCIDAHLLYPVNNRERYATASAREIQDAFRLSIFSATRYFYYHAILSARNAAVSCQFCITMKPKPRIYNLYIEYIC